MSDEKQIADTIEMLYKRLNEYNKQDLFNYGYLLESNQILCKDIEEKDKEIERLNNIINELESTFVTDDKRIKEYNIEHPESPLANYSIHYLNKLKDLKEGK